MLEPIVVDAVIKFHIVDEKTGKRYPVEWRPFDEPVAAAYARAISKQRV